MSENENTFTHTGLLFTYTLTYSEAVARWSWRGENGERRSPYYKTAESAQVFTRIQVL